MIPIGKEDNKRDLDSGDQVPIVALGLTTPTPSPNSSQREIPKTGNSASKR